MTELSLLDTDIEADLRASVRDLLRDRCDSASVTRMYDGDRALVGPLWRAVSQELGLSGLMIPEDLGGAGGSAREAAVVLEELGRAVAPVPFLTSSVIATSLLLTTPQGEASANLLAVLASGESTAAILIPFSAGSAAGTQRATIDSAGRLNGRVSSVAGALEADVLLVPVATPEGMAIYQVSANDAVRTPVVSLDMTRQLADVHLDAVQGTALIEPEGGAAALDLALTTGGALLASEQMGVAGWCLATTVTYLQQRRQFGRLVGSFQSVKHRLADLYAAIETAAAASAYAAAAVAADDDDVPVAAAVAQAWCGDVAVRAAEEAIQLHGGIGMTWEHPAHLYLKRAKADQIALGTSGYHRVRLAAWVDLPAPDA